MKIIILISIVLLMISCEDSSFKKAEMSKCINGTASADIIQPKVEITEETDEMVMPDEENDDSDNIEDEQATKVILIEKTESHIKFYYQSFFICTGFDYGYNIEPDSSDETVLELDTKRKDTDPKGDANCVCYKKMTVEYESDSQDLTKITKIRFVQDDGPYKVLEFDEDGDDVPQEDADVSGDEDAYVPDCGNLSAEECATASGCEKITGSSANAEEECWDKSITVGCKEIWTCNAMISLGYSSEDGKCYMFSDMCLSANWN
ncbi:MAG TPA: hypothetical protein PKG52_10965, partial [bacterium]|nr:hypothetical protein [bacterium]